MRKNGADLKSMKYVVCLALLMATQAAWGWGREGHRLTALVAEDHLTPEAKAQVKDLLGNETLAGVAAWADEYRVDHPETAPWHFVDIPKSETHFDRMRDCPPHAADPSSPWRDCVTDRILYFEGRLGDDSLPKSERAQALKFLVHFIGDVHQPFHAIGDERGGNGVRVAFLGSQQCGSYTCNLHGVWDESIIEHENLSEPKFVAHLEELIAASHWETMTGGDPTAWANVSHHYAVEEWAPDGALLDKGYVDQATKIVDAQLALGGLRLARVLNNIFAPL
jgi:hypothetical protein